MGDVDLVLHVRPCEGLVRQIDGTVEKRFAKKELLVPLQVGCIHSRGWTSLLHVQPGVVSPRLGLLCYSACGDHVDDRRPCNLQSPSTMQQADFTEAGLYMIAAAYPALQADMCWACVARFYHVQAQFGHTPRESKNTLLPAGDPAAQPVAGPAHGRRAGSGPRQPAAGGGGLGAVPRPRALRLRRDGAAAQHRRPHAPGASRAADSIQQTRSWCRRTLQTSLQEICLVTRSLML